MLEEDFDKLTTTLAAASLILLLILIITAIFNGIWGYLAAILGGAMITPTYRWYREMLK